MRVIIGIELVAALAALTVLSLGGSIRPFLSFMPLFFILAVPAIASLMVWKPAEVTGALRDAFSAGGLSLPGRHSADIWSFFEKAAYAGALAGILLDGVLVLTRLEDLLKNPAGTLRFTALLTGVYAILFGMLFRIMRNAIAALSSGNPAALDLELSGEFCARFGITGRESEVVQLMLRGRRYADIAGDLHISIKTVKTHIHHVYEKTSSGGRVDLIRMLQFRG